MIELLENDEVKASLNAAIGANNKDFDYETFRYHWQNFELEYALGIMPTEKQARRLVDEWKSENIPKLNHLNWVDAFRHIVKTRQCEKYQGPLIDVWTAIHVLKVYDALNDANKEKMRSLHVSAAVHIAMRYYDEH